MKCPAYVPPAVRSHVQSLIDGDDWEPQGLAKSLENAERDLAEAEHALARASTTGRPDHVRTMQRDRNSKRRDRDMLSANVACLRRLVEDTRMREVYSRLANLLTSDEEWRGFISSAWAAQMDYRPFRERLRRAAELSTEIPAAAEKLATLLREFGRVCPNHPVELYSVNRLLEVTESERDPYMWRSMRRHVLGLDKEEATKAPKKPVRAKVKLSRVVVDPGRVQIDPDEQTRNTLRYVWGTAPGIPELLAELGRLARAVQPREHGMIGAAIASRKKNSKAEYLRAFGELLMNVRHFEMTSALMNAMAVTATVVHNDPEIVVTFDDVRKAVARLR